MELEIEITAGLRWLGGRARMRLRKAMPRSNATLAWKTGNVRSGELSMRNNSLSFFFFFLVIFGLSEFPNPRSWVMWWWFDTISWEEGKLNLHQWKLLREDDIPLQWPLRAQRTKCEFRNTKVIFYSLIMKGSDREEKKRINWHERNTKLVTKKRSGRFRIARIADRLRSITLIMGGRSRFEATQPANISPCIFIWAWGSIQWMLSRPPFRQSITKAGDFFSLLKDQNPIVVDSRLLLRKLYPMDMVRRARCWKN